MCCIFCICIAPAVGLLSLAWRLEAERQITVLQLAHRWTCCISYVWFIQKFLPFCSKASPPRGVTIVIEMSFKFWSHPDSTRRPNFWRRFLSCTFTGKTTLFLIYTCCICNGISPLFVNWVDHAPLVMLPEFAWYVWTGHFQQVAPISGGRPKLQAVC